MPLLLGSGRVTSGAERRRDAIGRGRAADDLGLHVPTRIAFVGAQVGACFVRQALEADETCLQRAHFAARAYQSGGLLGGMSEFDRLGHAALTHDRPDQATPKFDFPYKFQWLIIRRARLVRHLARARLAPTVRGISLAKKMLFVWNQSHLMKLSK